MATNDYPYIRAHGKLMGSFPYYIGDEIARAREDGAPNDAVTWTKDNYHDRNAPRRWRVLSDYDSSYQERLKRNV